jgi:hypothetical protein
LVRYLKSAHDEFDGNSLEAARFVQETSVVARKIKLSGMMSNGDYRTFCSTILGHAYPQTHHVLNKAAETLTPQKDGESVQNYIERCEEDSNVLAFSLKCAKASKRERRTLLSTSITTAINGLHDRLQGNLVTSQKEQLMQNKTCTWNHIRIKAGARDDPNTQPTKKMKSAPANAVPIVEYQAVPVGVDYNKLAETIAASTSAAADKMAASFASALSSHAPAFAMPPFLPPQQRFAPATPQAPVMFTPPPVKPHEPTTNRTELFWPGMCSKCGIVHQCYEECPHCSCHNCTQRGHVAKNCPEPCRTCKYPAVIGATINNRHTANCATRAQAKNSKWRR